MRVRPSGVTQRASCYAANLHSTGNLEKASANNSLLSDVFFTLSLGATGISQQQLLFYKSMNNGAFGVKNCVSLPQKMTKTRTARCGVCSLVTSMPQLLKLPGTCIALDEKLLLIIFYSFIPSPSQVCEAFVHPQNAFVFAFVLSLCLCSARVSGGLLEILEFCVHIARLH